LQEKNETQHKKSKRRPNLILDDEEDVKPDVSFLMNQTSTKNLDAKIPEISFADLVQGQV